MRNPAELVHAVRDGAVKRIRPKTMTVAAPMLGGLFTSFLMELLIYPVIYFSVKLMSVHGGERSN
jgi:Cu(I)/Ag(I) efflux system membrane protein CusA/SilA